MAQPEDLSDAQVILLAVNLCAAGQIDNLHALVARVPDVLNSELVLRILLTFLPGSTEPFVYLPLLQSLASHSFEENVSTLIDLSSVENLKTTDAEHQLEGLCLTRLETGNEDNSQDIISQFLIHRAYQIDEETRNLPSVLQLVESFIDQSPTLRQWVISTLLPLVRSEYEYYPDSPLHLPLSTFDLMDDRAAISTLLQRQRPSGGETYIGRDLRGLVGPWMYGESHSKRRKLSHGGRRASIAPLTQQDDTGLTRWGEVNDWILTKSQEDFKLAASAFMDWEGPSDVDLGDYADESDFQASLNEDFKSAYVQTGLGMIYGAKEVSQTILEDSRRILDRGRALSNIDQPSNGSLSLPTLPSAFPLIANLSKASLLHNALLHKSNALTRPTAESLAFLEGILLSVELLRPLGLSMTFKEATELCLFANEDVQKQELHNLLQGVAKANKKNLNWSETRTQVMWLQSWGSDEKSNGQSRALFWRVDLTFLQMEFLDALLTAEKYQFAVDTFLKKPDPDSLTPEQIEDVVEKAILRSYDNASNGNRTRGGMKRASDILKAFQPHISKSSSIHNIENLLAATHSLSFYQLTLQHGVPFQPVNIRIHPDPIALIAKVLEQNSKAYTKLDDLVSIGKNFVRAGLPVSESETERALSSEEALLEAERRITYLSIESALHSSDFDTAYSYILTRLTPTSKHQTPASSSDDYSWRAAYLAGRNRSKVSSTPLPLATQISSLSKRMELLSLALTLAPTPDPLPEILGTWRRCEEELNSLKSAEAEEEAAWDAKGDTVIPGGFGPEGREEDIEETRRERAKRLSERKSSRKGYEEEAPMGLFDVARGAARAIGKSAFPLRGAANTSAGPGAPGRGFHINDPSHDDGSDMDRSFMSTDSVDSRGQRVRKRDMVSNMVTGGLVSGIGWVLGAQPVQKPGDSDEEHN